MSSLDFHRPRTSLWCPLCSWTLDGPVPDDDPAATARAVNEAIEHAERDGLLRPSLEAGAETLAEAIGRVSFTQLAASLQSAERAVRAHFESHDFLEWVAAASKLFTLRQSLESLGDAEPPDDARLSDAVNWGALAVNDVRWIQFATRAIDALKQSEETADA